MLGFAWVWYRFAVNIPFWDDLFVVENSLLPIHASTAFAEKLRYWFGWYTQTEHRIVYNRLVFWLIHAVGGRVDYRLAMVGGNLSLVGMGLLFLNVFRQFEFPAKFWLPVPFLLFGLASYYNQFWGMGAVSNFTVVWFVLLSVFFLVQSSWTRFGLAVLFALTATLTLATGLLVWAVGLVLLLFQRRYAPLTAWSLLTALTVALYVQGYVRPDWSPDPLRNAYNLIGVLRNFTGFLGATFDFLQPRQAAFVGYELFGIEYVPSVLPMLFGAALLVFAVVAVITRIRWSTVLFLVRREKSDVPSPPMLVVVGVVGFVLITALAASLNRAGSDVSAVVNSKYKIYSILFTIACYAMGLVLLRGPQRENLFRAALIFAVFWHVAGYAQYLPNVLNTRQALRADATNFQTTGSWRFYPAGLVTDLANRHTATIQRAGYYQLPAPLDLRQKKRSNFAVSVEPQGEYLQITEVTAPPPTNLRLSRFLVLSADSIALVFPASPRLASWWQTPSGRLFTNGWTSRVNKANIPQGRYRLGFYDEKEGILSQTNQFVTIQD